MTESEQILKEEIDGILDDIREKYEASGRKASGQFAEGLEAVYESSAFQYKGTIKGFTYLAGRGKTKNGNKGEPTVQQQILKWLNTRGIKPIEKKMTLNSLAYVIARKIHRQGTDRSLWLKIYEEVITPERIDRIIRRVSELNVNKIINQVRAEIEVLEKNV